MTTYIHEFINKNVHLNYPLTDQFSLFALFLIFAVVCMITTMSI